MIENNNESPKPDVGNVSHLTLICEEMDFGSKRNFWLPICQCFDIRHRKVARHYFCLRVQRSCDRCDIKTLECESAEVNK